MSHSPPIHVFSLHSHPAEILQAADDLCRFCEQQTRRSAGRPPQQAALQRLQLVVVEALNNIAEHAYENKTDGAIRVELTLGATGREAVRLRLLLRDTGRPNTHGITPQQLTIDRENLSELPEGGFGLNIMHQLCEELNYYRRNEENYFECSMLLKLSPDAESEC